MVLFVFMLTERIIPFTSSLVLLLRCMLTMLYICRVTISIVVVMLVVLCIIATVVVFDNNGNGISGVAYICSYVVYSVGVAGVGKAPIYYV